MALSSMWTMAWMKAARPSVLPKPRRGSSRGCTRRGRSGRPGMRIGSGGDAPASVTSRPWSNASAAACVASTLSSGDAAARHSRAASNSEPATRSGARAALLLRLVGAQLAQALEVAGIDPGHVLAAEAGAVEGLAGELVPGHRRLEVCQVLVDQPVAAQQRLDLALAATVRDQLLHRRHVDAVDV